MKAPAVTIDIKRLCGEVAARHSIRLEPSDPAFALVTLNQLILEDVARQLGEELESKVAEFHAAVHGTEFRAGRLLAEQVKAAAAELRSELQSDIESARLDASSIVAELHRAHQKPTIIRWGAAGLVVAATMFASGLWIGTHFLR